MNRRNLTLLGDLDITDQSGLQRIARSGPPIPFDGRACATTRHFRDMALADSGMIVRNRGYSQGSQAVSASPIMSQPSPNISAFSAHFFAGHLNGTYW